jgi:hypothetical protein
MGQGCELQTLCSALGHELPPCFGGTMTRTSRLRQPPPQLTEQGCHCRNSLWQCTGHATVSHAAMSCSFAGHAAPPNWAGWVMTRVRALTPAPQVSLQTPNAPQLETAQSTFPGVGAGVGGTGVGGSVGAGVGGVQISLSTVTSVRQPFTMLGCGSAASAHRYEMWYVPGVLMTTALVTGCTSVPHAPL